MFIKTFKKIGKLAATLVLTMMTINLIMVPSASALNSNDGGNKPLGFNGYQYVSNTQLNLFFGTQLSSSEVTTGQFTVKRHSDQAAVSVTAATPTFGTGYSGVTTTNLTKGTRVALTLDTLAYDTLYDVTIKGATLISGNSTNGFGITFGNYRIDSSGNPRSDFKFYMLTPTTSNGDYSSATNTTVNVAYTVGTTNVSYEDNLVVVCDRPLYTADASFITDLSSGYYNNSTTATVIQDDNYSRPAGSPLANAECYKPVANTANTTFIFPETVATDLYAVYNRTASASSYTLTLPDFQDKEGDSLDYVSGEDSISFSTLSGDLPLAIGDAPTLTDLGEGYYDVDWSASSGATSYKVYATDGDRLTGTYYYIDDSATNSYDDLDLSGEDYTYIRIVPVNSYGEIGFSQAAEI